ncbi:hypothetical protein AVEN_51520-1 [Araneus ventricosus]|uniref:Uncharacterized protein n=1 Tax=Araneus ventricosus TaxID=182803 RepID=A0A4Y2SN93_ARAVE|nr:hypothetical protein AVEN_133871-1 [Araneus ventricosus]GBN88565.1 hypothetical protein AVEN_51520-1 [Araneus ventricosus]
MKYCELFFEILSVSELDRSLFMEGMYYGPFYVFRRDHFFRLRQDSYSYSVRFKQVLLYLFSHSLPIQLTRDLNELFQAHRHGQSKDRTPSHAPASEAITATAPVGWTWDKASRQTERIPMPPYLMPLRQPNRLDGHVDRGTVAPYFFAGKTKLFHFS